MPGKIRSIAVIGLGGQSRSELIPALLRLDKKCEIVAICDISEENIALAKKLLPAEALVYKDYKDLFGDIGKKGHLKLDAIVLSVPHFLHAEIAGLAIKKGIGVFKEKPFGMNLKMAKEISSLAIKEGVQVYTVTKRQFYPSYAKGLELLSARVIGTPYMYSARHFMCTGNLFEGWRSSVQASGGGVLIDMGYHLLDVIMRYFGDVKEANLHWSNTAKPGYIYEVEDAATLNLWHSAGIQGVLQIAAMSGPKEESLEIRGTEGRLVITKKDVVVYDVPGEEKNRYTFEVDSIDAVVQALNEFFSDSKSIWSQNVSHNMKIMRVIDMAYERRFK